MRVFLVNPSHVSFGTAVITPRWLYVLAAATPSRWGEPIVADETLDPFDAAQLAPGDVVGIGIHTGNALRGYEVGQLARARGAYVVFGGIHATLYPAEAHALGGAHAVVRGDGDVIWATVIDDCAAGTPRQIYEAGRIDGETFKAARWDLLPKDRYMWGSIQTVRGCPKHCSFCSVWRTDGQTPRQAAVHAVIHEAVELRRRGFRFIALADDNFYPVTLADLAQAARRSDPSHLRELEAVRAERFALMDGLAKLPDDMVFFTQITMEAAEDPAFLQAMARARIRGALVGVEAVTPEGLKDVHKGFNLVGEPLVERLQTFRSHGVHVLGSFIFGLPSDRPETFKATADLAERAGITFAQFVMLTPYPGTVDFERWERELGGDAATVSGIPVTRHWLIPQADRPKVYAPHPVMSPDEIRRRTQAVWDHFYALPRVWRRSRVAADVEGPARVRAQLEVVSTDVCQHRDCDRFRPTRTIGSGRALDGGSVPPALRRSPDAAPRSSPIRFARDETVPGHRIPGSSSPVHRIDAAVVDARPRCRDDVEMICDPQPIGTEPHGFHGESTLPVHAHRDWPRQAPTPTRELFQRLAKQHSCFFPVTPHGARRDAQRAGDLFLGQAAEVAHLHHMRHPRIEQAHPIESFVHMKNLVGAGRNSRRLAVERDLPRAGAAPSRVSTAGDVDDHRSHHPSGPAHEVHAILEVEIPGAGEPEIRFVDERAGIEKRVAAAGPQARPRQAAQVVIGGGKQRIGRDGIGPGAVDQFRQPDNGGGKDRDGRAATTSRLARLVIGLLRLHADNNDRRAGFEPPVRGAQGGRRKAPLAPKASTLW